jgi:hypothetical protein
MLAAKAGSTSKQPKQAAQVSSQSRQHKLAALAGLYYYGFVSIRSANFTTYYMSTIALGGRVVVVEEYSPRNLMVMSTRLTLCENFYNLFLE